MAYRIERRYPDSVSVVDGATNVTRATFRGPGRRRRAHALLRDLTTRERRLARPARG